MGRPFGEGLNRRYRQWRAASRFGTGSSQQSKLLEDFPPASRRCGDRLPYTIGGCNWYNPNGVAPAEKNHLRVVPALMTPAAATKWHRRAAVASATARQAATTERGLPDRRATCAHRAHKVRQKGLFRQQLPAATGRGFLVAIAFRHQRGRHVPVDRRRSGLWGNRPPRAAICPLNKSYVADIISSSTSARDSAS
jgi:hypothetical protein